MDDLARWFGEQLDEDERIAKARRGIFPAPGVDDDGTVWLHIRPGGNAVIVRYRDPVAGYDDMAKLHDWADSKDGWTQERVLREVEARRGVLRQYEAIREQARNPVSAENRRAARIAQGELEDVVRLLAVPYADRPGYRQEWCP
ncbi:DUF6221 family protein [Streptomyces sp. NBC_00645]|uniref:DUF6221 family protein n=1 Tax=Streptomyces sp. NBC_00645 TaxID=2975795 RepID=UPI00324744B6